MNKKHSTLINQINICKSGLWVFFVLMLYSFNSQAQISQLPNGTVTTQEYINEIESNQIDERLMPFDPENPDLNEILTIEVFIVRDKHGNLNFNSSDLNTSVATLNSFFANIGLEFKTSEIKDVPEYEYNIITHRDSTKEIEVKYAVEDKINLFLVDSINLHGMNCYGYTFLPTEPDRNYIFLRKDHILGNYLITLMGSYFGLLFTHETLGGSEFVSGTNCGSTGDYICDTYADPGLFGLVDEECHYQGIQIDPEGNFYIPSVANIMSESPDSCKCIFTNEQYRRMKYYLFNLRDYLR